PVARKVFGKVASTSAAWAASGPRLSRRPSAQPGVTPPPPRSPSCSFVLAGVIGFAAVAVEPRARHYLLPADHVHTDPAERVRRIESSGESLSSGESATFTAFLFTHNL